MTCPRCGGETPEKGNCAVCGALLDEEEAATGFRSALPQPGGASSTGADDEGEGPTGLIAAPLRDDEAESEAPTGYASSSGSSGPRPTPAFPPDEGPLEVGQSFGRYHIIRLLGLGGMGAVYHAWDEELGVGVALKIVRPEVATNPQLARDLEKRFKRELLLARQVTHKNVVRIHDMGEIDGIKYITMPYVEGVDLATVLKSNDFGLPTEKVLAVARGIVSGLLAAHHAGVVHRDLKPANIMVEADTGDALIMDFGIARSSSSDESGKPGANILRDPIKAGLTMAGTVLGTLEYMAPEQARGQEVDHRADLYALGLILYDMFAGGRRARGTQSALLELRQRMVKPPPDLKELRPDLPAPLEQIISRLVEPDREKRHATTDELAAAFDRLDEHGYLLPLPKRFTKKFIAASVAAFLAALVVTWQIARTRVPPEPPPPMSVLVADFDNRTGDPVFEGSVEQALAVALEGASFITAYPREDALRLAIRTGAGERLDESVARLVSAREGIKVILEGTIAAEGSAYRVSVRALDSTLEGEEGEPLATASATARDKAQVLQTIGALAARLRGVLGDTAPESARLEEAETFTTASIEAMQAYAKAQELARLNRNEEALAEYERAISFDPEFGRAYAGIAVVQTVFKNEAKAKAAYEEALKRVGRMSEREKYRTFGTYYLSVARNYEKAIENYEKLVELYPADRTGHGNLALAYLYTGNIKGAVAEVRKVLEIYPKNSLQRYNFSMYSLYAGDFPTALREATTIVNESPPFTFAFLPIALATALGGDLASALDTYAKLEETGAAGASLARLGRADVEMYRGRNREALRLLKDAVTRDEESGNPGVLARDYVAVAEAHLAVGDERHAVEFARKAIELSSHESVLFPAAMIFLDADLEEEAEKIALTLDNMLQTHTTAYARLIDAEILVRKGRYGTAIETFRASIARRDTWFARFLLARVYAETEHFPEALAELELCANRVGEAADAFFYDTPTLRYLPPVYYWLARAQQAIGVDEARGNYERFLGLRTDSDSPDPLAADARERIAALLP